VAAPSPDTGEPAGSGVADSVAEVFTGTA